jgi:hypothetical protein
MGRNRALLAIEAQFLRALPVALLGALATGAGAWFGAGLAARQGDVAALAAALGCAGLAYGAVLLIFRKSLPTGRAA